MTEIDARVIGKVHSGDTRVMMEYEALANEVNSLRAEVDRLKRKEY